MRSTLADAGRMMDGSGQTKWSVYFASATKPRSDMQGTRRLTGQNAELFTLTYGALVVQLIKVS